MCRMHVGSTQISNHKQAGSPPPHGSTRGFSLIEAMVVMAVAAIGLAVGVPSYQGMIERTRISSAMHLLTAHMASARNTAISYRIPTVVCPSNQVGGCRTDGDWSQGWLMFFDPDGNRQPDLPQDILRDENAPIHPSLRIVSSSGRVQLRYLPDGRVDRIVRIAAPQPSCVALRGDTLFISSARVGLPAHVLAAQPASGGIFAHHVGRMLSRGEDRVRLP